MFRQAAVLSLRPLPPQQRRDHQHIAHHVRTVGRAGAEAGQQQAAGRRADGAGDVDAQRIQRHGVFQLGARHQLRHDRLPGRPHQRRADAADKGQRQQVFHRQRTGLRQQQQAAADAGQQNLHEDQKAPPIENVRQYPGRDRQQEHRQRGGGLHQRHRRGVARQIGDQPRAGDVAHKAADVAEHRGTPQHRK
ncbi:Uncharacterised protein [Serratia marcescens]|nr:Uncharacterised protein [Serratia marcescens]